MKIREISEILGAEVLCCHELLDTDVHSACGCDVMSDVLAFVKDQSVLLTGLVNLQSIRTADMMDMKCIVFGCGKKPDDAMLHLAVERGIVLLSSPLRMYIACGRLYSAGLAGMSEE